MTGDKTDTYLESGTEDKSDFVDRPMTDMEAKKEEIIEIKNPVYFTMLHESEVKVLDTDSSKANLILNNKIAYDDDHTQHDQIISPSDGIQVQNGKFY